MSYSNVIFILKSVLFLNSKMPSSDEWRMAISTLQEITFGMAANHNRASEPGGFQNANGFAPLIITSGALAYRCR
jgi:hypothetical protein